MLISNVPVGTCTLVTGRNIIAWAWELDPAVAYIWECLAVVRKMQADLMVGESGSELGS